MGQYNNAQMRKWVAGFFEDPEDFDFFCEDQFPGVFEQFADGDSLNKKARTLTKYCEENNQYDVLIEKLKDEDPDRFNASPPPAPLEDVEASSPVAETAPATTAELEPAAPDELAPAPETSEPDKPDEEPVSVSSTGADDEPPDKPEGSPDVFISYSRRDEDFIRQLYHKLTSNGVSAWYDRVAIKPGELWRESIVEGVTNSKMFLLVLSPDSTASDPVRREISLAQSEDKTIVPIMWRKTDFPSTIKYQLAGIQYIDFEETASEANFTKAINAVNRLLGKDTAEDVISDEPTIAPEITPEPKSKKPLSRAKRKQLLAVQATRQSVMTRLITPMRLEDEDKEQHSSELGWLFTAADHLLAIKRGDAAPNSPVPVDVPKTAEGSRNNIVQDNLDDFSLKLTESQVTSIIKQINIYLRNLNIELRKLAQVGGEDHASVALQNSIYSQRKSIVERTNELADLMYDVYGTKVNSPEILLDELEAQQLG